MQTSIQELWLIFFGGGWGSISRYLVGKLIAQQVESALPLGTLVVNVGGCFLIGMVLALVEDKQMSTQQGLLLATGFCGGFTTFSTFAYENKSLLYDQSYFVALGYSLLSLILGILAAGWGNWLAQLFRS